MDENTSKTAGHDYVNMIKAVAKMVEVGIAAGEKIFAPLVKEKIGSFKFKAVDNLGAAKDISTDHPFLLLKNGEFVLGAESHFAGQTALTVDYKTKSVTIKV